MILGDVRVNSAWIEISVYLTCSLTSLFFPIFSQRVPDNDEIIFRVKCVRGTQNCRARCTFENNRTQHYLVDTLDGKGTVALANIPKLDRKAWWCLD